MSQIEPSIISQFSFYYVDLGRWSSFQKSSWNYQIQVQVVPGRILQAQLKARAFELMLSAIPSLSVSLFHVNWFKLISSSVYIFCSS